MSWSLKFDEPITLSNGKALVTLRDAGNYVVDLPASKSIREHWQLARTFLVSAAEGKGSVWMARLAVVRALNHGKKASSSRRPQLQAGFKVDADKKRLAALKTGWSRRFDDPIPLPGRGQLVTLRDAGVYIVALPPRE